MGLFRKIEDFIDETHRMATTYYIPPTSDVEVSLPQEWDQVTSEGLRKKLGLKVGKRAVGTVVEAGCYEGETDELFD